jgi:hypothetical protein
MSLKLANNASSVLAGSIDGLATSISVSSGAGSKFPSLGAGDWFPLTLVDASGNYEIVKCTARSGDVMTVTRGQEGTSAASFAAGSRIDLRLTAAAISEVTGAVDDLAGSLPGTYVSIENAASEEEAEEGTASDKWMTPERVKQAIDSLSGSMAAKDVATAADIIANTGSDGITTDQLWETGAFVDVAANGTCTLDLDTGSNFKVTLNGNTTMAFPANAKVGQVVNILFVQGGTARTISWASGWYFPDNTAPLYGTTVSAKAGFVSGVVQDDSSTVLASGGKL